ncbi:P-loop containing NTP hydrolase pore-1-domain-containing protein [Tribonema minus]|uniref:P-loop containing NTP hydrolase pore-1-domain-containing protein n=1 Tax=Tribonema minus TaxID=303371 RepID=A0A835YXT2_9STRA|nr:P-loop containing NTP hydrolase pore-1-domain-containing protein [Tribonema minus]
MAIGHQHPGLVAESALLSAVPLPPLAYPSDVFQNGIAEKRLLSSLQLEGVLYACQRHQSILPSGKRSGMFIGDGAGVGKGRQIAGIILDNYARGRTKHVWLSIASDLRADAERDLADIGCHINVIDGCQALDAASSKGLGTGSSARDGVLFTTYSTLISSGKGTSGGNKRSRLQQIVDWCGGHEFDGCIMMDEAHKAKNFNAKKEESSTKVSQAVLALQDALPLARVVYLSATGVTDVTNLAYCDRLGLWGPQTPFSCFKDFMESMDKRGLGALEMLALELKAAGAYVSRGLSWQGAEFDTVECELPLQAVAQNDAACKFWQHLRSELEQAVRLTGVMGACSAKECVNGVHVCNPMRMFWAVCMRFFKELAIAYKVPFAVDCSQRAIAEGHSVVIGLQSTGEAGLECAMEKLGKRPGETVRGMVSSARHSAHRFITQFFPVRTKPEQRTVPTEDDYKSMLKARMDAARASGVAAEAVQQSQELAECVAAREKLLEDLQALDLPPSPLDALIDALGGPANVAEMTGRKARIARCQRTGKLRYELRPEGQHESLNIQERKHFMAGRKHVAIISDAASTGISLHAAVGSGASNRRRVHITLELAWAADKSIQQLGRSHRSHQESAPLYKLLMTNLGGERRFASAVAKRLMSLGALTKGDRRAASGGDMSAFDLDNKYGRTALKTVCASLQTATALAPGVALASLAPYIGVRVIAGEADEDPGNADALLKVLTAAKEGLEAMGLEQKNYSNVTMFLTRLQILPVARQNLLFAYFATRLDAVVREAKAAGLYDAGVADLLGSSVRLLHEPEVVAVDASGSQTRLSTIELDRGVSWDHANAKRAAAQESAANGFYRSVHRDITTQQHLVLLAVQRYVAGAQDADVQMHAGTRFVITRPSTGTSPFEMDGEDLAVKYRRIPDEADSLASAEAAWTQVYEDSKTAARGSRLMHISMLHGSVLPIWDALERTKTNCATIMTKAEQSLKVYRVALDSGEKLVGVRLPPAVVDDLKRNLHAVKLAREAGTRSGEALVTEPVAPIRENLLKKASTPKRTVLSYFSPVNGGNTPKTKPAAAAAAVGACTAAEAAPAGKRAVAAVSLASRTTSSSKKRAKPVHSPKSFFSPQQPPAAAAPTSGIAIMAAAAITVSTPEAARMIVDAEAYAVCFTASGAGAAAVAGVSSAAAIATTASAAATSDTVDLVSDSD